ncbi:MAG TPA: hypothetical protein VGI81_00955 [Tepidisphaeraceae bacterium]
MRSALVTYPVRRIAVPTVRRKGAGRRSSTAKMLGKLEAASSRLAAARRGR